LPDAATPMPVPESVLDAARDRIRRLPPATRGAPLAAPGPTPPPHAAAAPPLRLPALNRPTTALVPPADLAPAEADGLVEVGFDGRIAFSHPLFGAAVYCDATPCDTRA